MKGVMLLALATLVMACGKSESRLAGEPTLDSLLHVAVDEIVASAARIPNSSKWFEVVRLPNRVYAFWEPGHVEKVNSFLVLGLDQDILYDTGMGIANIRTAIEEVRRSESLPAKPIMVVNSHNHLDHNGGNNEFDQVWTVDDPWAITRLTRGVPGGEAGGFVSYWSELTPHPGVEPPPAFSPETHGIAPYPKEQIRFLEDEQIIDLGDRRFTVIRTFSHSPDGITLYNEEAGLFFGGDTFYGPDFLVTDAALLADDLRRIEHLPIKWHYGSHGPQLITAMQQGRQLAAVERMLRGQGESGITKFAGFQFPQQSLDGVTITIAKELLLY